MDFQAQIERILNKLKQVRVAGKSSFGSESHKFRLAERVRLESIRLFESQHGIVLPEDYRQFLVLAGGSGAGPYYGILPLDMWDRATTGKRSSLPIDYLARPCPLVPGAKPRLSVDNEFRYPSDEVLQGSIALVSQGCCYFAILVISGPARGRVAYISEEVEDVTEMAYFPENPNFLSWYERWLDELLGGYDTSWFGYGAVGTEGELALRLQDSAGSAENKSEALRTLMRINPLTPSTMNLLSTFSKDTSEAPIPRATAASLFISRSLHDDPAYVSQLLQDCGADVREEVLLALSRRKSPMLANAVRQGIQDADPKVAKTALLHGKGILTRDEIGPFLKSENLDLRRTAIYALGRAPDAQVDELIGLASHDTDQDCRIYAIRALGDLKNRTAVSALEELLKCEADQLIRPNILRALQSIGYVIPLPAAMERARSELTETTDPHGWQLLAAKWREIRLSLRVIILCGLLGYVPLLGAEALRYTGISWDELAGFGLAWGLWITIPCTIVGVLFLLYETVHLLTGWGE